MKTHYLFILVFFCLAGCSRTQPQSVAPVVGDEQALNDVQPAYIVRVQSSYGDIQQIEVNVKEWVFDGEDQRQFDKKKTPFDIPIAPGKFSLRLQYNNPGAEIKLQLLNPDGILKSIIQSKEVCVFGDDSGVEVRGCMNSMR